MPNIPCPQCRNAIKASPDSAGQKVVCLKCGAECLVPASVATPEKLPLPWWAWVFAAACALIPIITIGGAIPTAIGFGGAAACLGIARMPTMHAAARVGICSGVAFACWFAFGLLVIGVALVQGPGAGTAQAAAPAKPRSSIARRTPMPRTPSRVALQRGLDPVVERDLDALETVPIEPEPEPVVAVEEDPKIYLADFAPESAEGGQPFRGLRGITIDGVKYEHAIWAQPDENFGTCRITYRLEGKYSRLRGVAGMCDDTNRLPPDHPSRPSAVFRIRADNQLVWRSMNISGAGAVEPVDLDVTGVRMLELSCEGGTYDYMVRTAWGDLELFE
jgi:hypothetical protein